LPAKQGLIRDFIDVVLEALAASTPTIRSLLLRRLAYLADGQQLAEDPLGKKARGQLLARPRRVGQHREGPFVGVELTCQAHARTDAIEPKLCFSLSAI
jgi:hypothetical protein